MVLERDDRAYQRSSRSNGPVQQRLLGQQIMEVAAEMLDCEIDDLQILPRGLAIGAFNSGTVYAEHSRDVPMNTTSSGVRS